MDIYITVKNRKAEIRNIDNRTVGVIYIVDVPVKVFKQLEKAGFRVNRRWNISLTNYCYSIKFFWNNMTLCLLSKNISVKLKKEE